MNLKNVATLIDDQIMTIGVRHSSTAKVYTYKCPTDILVKLGDTMIVKNANGFTTGTVERIDEEPRIDPDSEIKYCWAFQVIDVAKLFKLEEREKGILKKLQDRRRVSVRQQAMAALGIDADFLKEIK